MDSRNFSRRRSLQVQNHVTRLKALRLQREGRKIILSSLRLVLRRSGLTEFLVIVSQNSTAQTGNRHGRNVTCGASAGSIVFQLYLLLHAFTCIQNIIMRGISLRQHHLKSWSPFSCLNSQRLFQGSSWAAQQQEKKSFTRTVARHQTRKLCNASRRSVSLWKLTLILR